MDPYIKLAKETIEEYVKNGKIIKSPKDLPREMLENQAGVFATIYKDGQLRGCIGTFLPTKKNIAEEIIANAISSATDDPRFSPVESKELSDLEISVDVLSAPEEVASLEDLDPKKYGVLVRADDGRSGLLLPDLEGVNTVEEQVSIACQKAGIDPEKEEISLFRFSVERHE